MTQVKVTCPTCGAVREEYEAQQYPKMVPFKGKLRVVKTAEEEVALQEQEAAPVVAVLEAKVQADEAALAKAEQT
jgi:hypothetical protein